MNKAFKYRIYPTDKQLILFLKTFGCCRKVWNLMLSDKIEHYEKTKESLVVTPAKYKDEFPFLKEVDSLALANVQQHLGQAYQNFFEQPKVGFPKFKSKHHSRKSYTTNNQKGSVAVLDGYIKLPKVGKVKAVIHRTAPDGWKLKTATVSMNPDGSFYVSVMYEYDYEPPVIPIDYENAIGLDYKSDGLFMDSDGRKADMPHFYRESQNKLAKAQRKQKHKTVGSNNYNKQKQKIAKVYRHMANQRKDYLEKLSTEIANQYDVVIVESLNMKAMANKKFGNGKATLDNGYGMFLTMLERKLTHMGKVFLKVDKWFPSSQLCCCCGHKQKLSLSDRVFVCPECGLKIDRDLNAAINIKNKGLQMLTA